jgi:hypothetical protein
MKPTDPRLNEAAPLDMPHDLCEGDARALEALCAAGFDCDRVPAELRARAMKCAAMLGLLGCGGRPECDASLVDVTLVRVSEIRRMAEERRMDPLDEDALEALVIAGFEPAKCASGLRGRAEKHAASLAMLDMPVSAASREVLVSATLLRVQGHIDSGQSRMRIDQLAAGGLKNFRWSDLISVAAMLMLASAVIMPMVGAVRNYSRQTGCQAGLGSSAGAFGLYANDNRESLPLASESPAGAVWMTVGDRVHSNSANLYKLPTEKYLRPCDLACPGNALACRSTVANPSGDWKRSEEVSYSYRSMFAPRDARPSWSKNGERTIVLADRSPVFVRAITGNWFNPTANSDNHAQAWPNEGESTGQNVLYNDGSAAWLKSPVLASGDNIWLPRSFEMVITRLQEPTRAEPLKGVETPADRTDVFLSP